MRITSISVFGLLSLGAYAQTSTDHFDHDATEHVDMIARGNRRPTKSRGDKLGFTAFTEPDYKGESQYVLVYTKDTVRPDYELSDCLPMPNKARSLTTDRELQCHVYTDQACQVSGGLHDYGKLSGFGWNPWGTKDGWAEKAAERWWNTNASGQSVRCYWMWDRP